MMDLGDAGNERSEKTGFAESTIRRRVKLLELDADKFKKSEERQVSMSEYDKLVEIKDEEKWVRVEVRDENGKKAWSNIFVI
jgi:ParB family chromosome partitioning protein